MVVTAHDAVATDDKKSPEMAKTKIASKSKPAAVAKSDAKAATSQKAAGRNAKARQLRLKASRSILAGRLFDDRGNKMTATHTNKQGARYRYYISQAALQKRKSEAGSVTRLPAHEIEVAVVKAVREYLEEHGRHESKKSVTDRELIESAVAQIVVGPKALQIRLISGPGEEVGGRRDDDAGTQSNVITVPWAVTGAPENKGILHSPSPKPTHERGEPRHAADRHREGAHVDR